MNRRISILAIIITVMALVSSCAQNNPAKVEIPLTPDEIDLENSVTPNQTISPIATYTKTPIPLAPPIEPTSTWLPFTGNEITGDNINQINTLRRWAVSGTPNVFWPQNGDFFLVGFQSGTFLIDSSTYEITRFIDTSIGDQADSPSFSQDGTLLAVNHSIWNIQTGERLALGYEGYYAKFSQDGSMLGYITDTKIRIKNLYTDQEIMEFDSLGMTLAKTCFEFSPDNRSIAVLHRVDDNLAVKLWDIDTKQLLTSYTMEASSNGDFTNVTRMAFSPDSALLAVAVMNPYGRISIFDTVSGELKTSLAEFKKPINQIVSVAFTADRNGIFVGEIDGNFRFWNIKEKKREFLISANSNGIGAVVLSPDMTHLLSISPDYALEIRDARNGDLKFSKSDFQIPPSLIGRIDFIKLTHDDRVLVTASYEGQIQFRDVNNNQVLKTISINNAILDFDISEDDQYIAAYSRYGRIYLWKIDHNRDWVITNVEQKILVGSDDRFKSVDASGFLKFMSGGKLAATHMFRLYIFDCSTGKELHALSYNRSDSGKGSLDVSHDQTIIATVEQDGYIFLWRTSDWQMQKKLHVADNNQFRLVRFTPNDQYIVAVSWGNGNEAIKVFIWDRNSYDLVKTLETPFSYIGNLSFSKDSRLLLLSGFLLDDIPNFVMGYDTQNWNPIPLEPSSHRQVEFTPNGKYIISIDGWSEYYGGSMIYLRGAK